MTSRCCGWSPGRRAGRQEDELRRGRGRHHRRQGRRGRAAGSRGERTMTISDLDPRLIGEQPGLAGAWAGFRRRLAQGELGSLPVVLGIAIIWLIFWIANDRFLSAGNLTNLVLLLGEIDLSVGALSGLCAAIMAVLNVQHGVPGWLAILAGLASGTAVGAFQGFWTTRFR